MHVMDHVSVLQDIEKIYPGLKTLLETKGCQSKHKTATHFVPQ